MTARVGFVCTNYNNSAYTRAAVESLRRADGAERVRVVVVDNASRTEDQAALRALQAEFPAIDVVFNAENTGYFPGLNTGIARMRALHPTVDLLAVGNNDLQFPPAFVTQVEAARDRLDQWAVVAPDLVTDEGVHQNPHVLHPISSVRRFIWDVYFRSFAAATLVRTAARLTRRFTVREENAVGSTLYRTAGPVEQGYGACYLLGPKFFRHFDGLFAPTFLMQEEFFLYEQLKTIDQLTFYDPCVVVRHRGHASMGMLPGRQHWEISRDAHRTYRAFRRLDAAERAARISSAVGIRR
jgi:GT2 family glycosyltransferase